MNAIDFKGSNVKIAEHQDEFETLPAFAQENGIITYCMKLTDGEVNKIVSTGKGVLTFLVGDKPPQPVSVSPVQPDFPIDPRVKNFVVSANHYGKLDNGNGYAQFGFDFRGLLLLKKNKCIWVSVITYNTPLQPIFMELR